MQKSSLEQLIEFPHDGSSTERRELMRLCTDSFLAAPDRYGIREMEFFDLLYTNTGRKMDHQNRKLLVASLNKAGVPKEQIADLVQVPSMLGQILRRSATQTLPDLIESIREKTRTNFGSGALIDPAPHVTLPEHRFSLPSALLEEMQRFIQLSVARKAVASFKGKLAPVINQIAQHNHHRVIEECQIEARDAILEAHKAVHKKARTNQIKEDYIAELIDTGHRLQLHFALAHMLQTDSITILRIYNDASWESLALASRSARMSRACFSKIINSMHGRENDNSNGLRIMGLYNDIPEESADRVMRFWQIRVSALKEMTYSDKLADHDQPANSNEMQEAGDAYGTFGKR